MNQVPHTIKDLCDLLRECNVTPRIGLEAQGHIPTVERMLAEGPHGMRLPKPSVGLMVR